VIALLGDRLAGCFGTSGSVMLLAKYCH
jgi:hypothetical protein